MTNTVCCECGEPLHPGEADANLVGFGPDGEIYRHSGTCTETATERDSYSVKCRGCPRHFDRRSGEAGRPAVFHSPECRRAHQRRVDQLWRDAARGRLPDGLDALEQRRNELTALVADLKAGRFNGRTQTADQVLQDYARQLAGAIREAVDEQRRQATKRFAEQHQQAVDARRAAARAERDAFEAAIK